MGKVKQRYKEEWKVITDARGIALGKWLSKSKDEYKGNCTVCGTEISVANAGSKALLQHAEKKKHISAIDAFLQQPKLTGCQASAPRDNAADDRVTASEIRWAAYLCEHDLSLNMSDDAGKLFSAMFPDSSIGKSFTCGRTKATYLITEGLGSFYHDSLVNILRTQPFSLLIDESNKSRNKKYLNLLVRYFDGQKPVTSFYQTKEVNRGKADVIVEAIKEAFVHDQVPWTNVVQVMSDSPNVMRGAKNGVIAQIKARHAPSLVDIGGCSLHHVSNAVSYGTQALGDEVELFAVDVFAFFKHRTGLSQDFKDVQQILSFPEHKVLRFVSTRWLSILPVCERLAEQWEPLKQFFTGLKSTNADVAKQERTKRITKHLEDPTTHSKILFLTSVLPQLQRFEKLFQSDSVMIHALHNEMFQLLRSIMVMFVQPHVLQRVNSPKELLELECGKITCQLEDQKLFVGSATEVELKKMKFGELKKFYLDVRSFYNAVCKKLLQYLPLQNPVLQSLQFLHPSARQLESSEAAVSKIATVLQPFTSVRPDDALLEWRSLTLQDDNNFEKNDVAQYWQHSLTDKRPSGQEKFPKLSALVACAMVIAHGNAETERTFSQVANIITKQRNCLETDTLNGIMAVKNFLATSKSHAHDIEIPPDLLQSAKTARTKFFNKKTKSEDTEAAKRRQDDTEKRAKIFMAELNAASNIQTIEKDVTSGEDMSQNLRKKAQSLMGIAMEYNKQSNDALKQAAKVEKENKTKQKRLDSLKEKFLQKKLKRVSEPPETEAPTKQKKVCEKEHDLNYEIVSPPDTPEYASVIDSLGAEMKIDCIRGDGNCFFRAIGKSIHGTELVHEEVRNKICRHMLEHESYFSQYIDGDVKTHSEAMKRSGKWATQAEVFAAASCYKTDIFVLIPVNGEYRWHKFSPMEYGSDCYITLVNTNGNHYDRVCSVTGKCNCALPKPIA